MLSGSESNKRCPRCNAPLAEGATTCPNCGQTISSIDPTVFAPRGTPADPYNPSDPYRQSPSSYGQNPPHEQTPYGQNPPPYGQNSPPYGQPPPYGQSNPYNMQAPPPPLQPFTPMPSPPPKKRLSPWLIGAIVVSLVVLVGGGTLCVVLYNIGASQANTDATATAQTQSRIHTTATTQAIATATAAVSDPHTPAGATLIINDPLTHEGNWLSSKQCQFQADGYHVSSVTTNTSFFCEGAGLYTNASFQVGVKLLKGPCVGLNARDNGQTNINGYLALVCNDNSYQVVIYNNGTGTILDQGTTTVFHSASNQENILTLVANGKTIEFYVNGAKLSSVTDSTYTGKGLLGLVSDSHNAPGSEAVFDHAKVWTF